MRNKFVPKRDSGFTLLELMVVLIILAIVATFAVPQVMKYLGSAKSKAAVIQISNLATVLDLYQLETGRLPTTSEGLGALVDKPPSAEIWNGPYVKKQESLIDPWGREYEYRAPGEHGAYDLFTLGADAAVGGEGEDDDVSNW